MELGSDPGASNQGGQSSNTQSWSGGGVADQLSTAATGGAWTATGSTSYVISVAPTGGRTNTGGAPATGGATVTSGAGLLTPNGYLTVGNLKGYTWTAVDPGGSTLNLAQDALCVAGTVAKVPFDGGVIDYASVWGVMFAWNLNQAFSVDAGVPGPTQPANLSDFYSVSIALAGAEGLTLRAEFEFPDLVDGHTNMICATLPATGASLPLRSFKPDCWDASSPGIFDPTTMRPNYFGIQIVSDTSQAYPFNFCVTGLWFDIIG